MCSKVKTFYLKIKTPAKNRVLGSLENEKKTSENKSWRKISICWAKVCQNKIVEDKRISPLSKFSNELKNRSLALKLSISLRNFMPEKSTFFAVY